MINEKGNIAKAPETAPRTCFSEQNPPGSNAVQHRSLPRRANGHNRVQCHPAHKSRSPRVTASFSRRRSSGTAADRLEDPALRSITGNSFGFLPAAGLSRDVTWPSTSRPLGTPAGPEEPSMNDFNQSRLPVGIREIRSRQLRPVVSSDRRMAVEILVVRSARKVLRVTFSYCFEGTRREAFSAGQFNAGGRKRLAPSSRNDESTPTVRSSSAVHRESASGQKPEAIHPSRVGTSLQEKRSRDAARFTVSNTHSRRSLAPLAGRMGRVGKLVFAKASFPTRLE